MVNADLYQEYLRTLTQSYQKLSKIEFLQPDNSVAFTLDNNYKRGYRTEHDTRAFIQSGTLTVSLQNGQRRKATITLANLDSAFDYNINKIWFGQRVRLSMGLKLPSGYDFYLPQGVFYINNPQQTFSPEQKSVTYNLVDKWSYLDGSLFGNFEATYQVNTSDDVFEAMEAVLKLSKIDYSSNAPSELQIDNVKPIFTNYYNNRAYSDGTPYTALPYTVSSNETAGKLLLELNTIIAGLIGYDMTGALRIEPSQEDVSDADKPILWTFSPENTKLFSINETCKNSEVYNDIKIIGEGLDGREIWGRAMNFDISSDTNIKIIGDKLYKENRAEYYHPEQCVNIALWELKRRTILQKAITIECDQVFHLVENRLIAVKRTDKPNTPLEKYLIQGFSLPIAETGSMSISATSVQDLQIKATTTQSE